MREQEKQKVSLEDLKSVLEKMKLYKMRVGYMNFDNSGKFNVWQSEPSFGGARVTQEDVQKYINEY